MKQTLELAAINELFFSYACTSRNLSFWGVVYDRNAMLNMFRKGAEWQARQSLWISVNERLPEEGDPVLIRLKDGVVRLACYDIEEDSNIYFWNDNYAYETFRPWDVTHWREIPSFDEILEANRDVLERIKEKGD
jgi:hypothetical protein